LAAPVFSYVLFREQGLLGERFSMVDPGTVWVLRSVVVYANVGATGIVELFISELPSNAALQWYEVQATERHLFVQDLRQVVEYNGGAGGLHIVNSGSAPCDVSISGYKLTSP
jgi:hypothetical protein